jgi:NADH-quinone oxidoreductase subunit H
MNSSIVSYLGSFEFFNSFIKSISTMLGFDATSLIAFIVFVVAALIVANVAALIGGLGTYAERKISADLQARMGPNRVGPFGILQFLADGIKMLLKEDIMPKNADKFLFYLAPMMALVGVFATLAVLPISSGFSLTDINVGVFYLIAISSLVGVAVFLGGYSANSKWSMLGGMRGASQFISYEIPVTLSVLAIVLLAGGMSFGTIVGQQSGMPWGWYMFHNPFSFIGFFIFFIAGLAEANRAPFDLPESESELVSGYNTEYTGMRFGLFALAEYIEVFVLCTVAAALFMGGYNVPFNIGGDTIVGQILQVGAFLTKSLALYYVVIWIRWTFPRLRVDQVMTVCWKYLTPISLFNLIGTAVWVVVFDGRSILEIITGK